MTKINRLNIFSFAKFQSVLFALLGLGAGFLYSFGGLLIDTLVSLGWYSTPETPGLSIRTILAFGALIGIPLIFAVAGYILGIVETLFYNLFSRWYKGLTFKHG